MERAPYLFWNSVHQWMSRNTKCPVAKYICKFASHRTNSNKLCLFFSEELKTVNSFVTFNLPARAVSWTGAGREAGLVSMPAWRCYRLLTAFTLLADGHASIFQTAPQSIQCSGNPLTLLACAKSRSHFTFSHSQTFINIAENKTLVIEQFQFSIHLPRNDCLQWVKNQI